MTSRLKNIREACHLTQEELSAKSGISVRTIQRIEAGTAPKGFTLKALAAALEVSEKELLTPAPSQEETEVEQPIVTPSETTDSDNTLVKIINLSSVPFAWCPVANFLVPLLIMLLSRQKSALARQIISLQIFIAILFPVIFMIIIFLKLGRHSAIITMVALTLANLFIILRNTYEIDKRKNFVTI